jgi:hypothetical protein
MVEINEKGAKRKANTVEGMRGEYLCTRGVGGIQWFSEGGGEFWFLV